MVNERFLAFKQRENKKTKKTKWKWKWKYDKLKQDARMRSFQKHNFTQNRYIPRYSSPFFDTTFSSIRIFGEMKLELIICSDYTAVLYSSY